MLNSYSQLNSQTATQQQWSLFFFFRKTCICRWISTKSVWLVLAIWKWKWKKKSFVYIYCYLDQHFVQFRRRKSHTQYTKIHNRMVGLEQRHVHTTHTHTHWLTAGSPLLYFQLKSKFVFKFFVLFCFALHVSYRSSDFVAWVCE